MLPRIAYSSAGFISTVNQRNGAARHPTSLLRSRERRKLRESQRDGLKSGGFFSHLVDEVYRVQ